MEGNQSTSIAFGSVYHATPLHYLPEILIAGALRSQQIIGRDRARLTARKRDRLLQVDRYVHCSLAPRTPLLIHKLRQGYPHVLLEFDLGNAGGLKLAALPSNTKAWRSKWQCRPVTEAHDITRLLRLYHSGKRFRSLEVLVEDCLPLTFIKSIIAVSEEEFSLIAKILGEYHLDIPITLSSQMVNSEYNPLNLETIRRYYDLLIRDGKAEVPILPFD